MPKDTRGHERPADVKMACRHDPYPDNSAIFARKEDGRRKRASISFAEKLVALDELKQRAEPIIRAREERKKAKRNLPPGSE